MKKILNIVILAIVCFTFGACSSGLDSKAEAIAQKITNDEELTQEDYTVVFTYCNQALDFTIDALKALNGKITKEDADKIEKDALAKYPHFESFMEVLARVNDSKLDDNNKALAKERFEKIREIMGLMK